MSSQPSPSTRPLTALSSECLHRWRLHSLSGQIDQVSHHHHSKNLPVLKQDSLNVPGCLLPCHWVPLPSPGSISPAPPREFKHTEPLLCRLGSASSQPLLPPQLLQGGSQSVPMNLISIEIFLAGLGDSRLSLPSLKADTPAMQQSLFSFLSHWPETLNLCCFVDTGEPLEF